MVFCRGCGKQIHETAESCPHCGASKIGFPMQEATHHWSSITSLITGIIFFLMALTEPNGKWETEAVIVGMILGSIPIASGFYSFTISNNKNRWMATTGLILGVIIVLLSIGSM